MSTDKTALTAEEFVKAHFKGIEKETWYPAIVVIAEGFSSQQNKKLIEENQKRYEVNWELLEEKHKLISKIEELEKDALEREFKLNTYITDSTNLTVQNNSLQSQLKESQQLNERLVAGLRFVMGYVNKTETLMQDVSFTDQLDDIKELLSSTKEKGGGGCSSSCHNTKIYDNTASVCLICCKP